MIASKSAPPLGYVMPKLQARKPLQPVPSGSIAGIWIAHFAIEAWAFSETNLSTPLAHVVRRPFLCFRFLESVYEGNLISTFIFSFDSWDTFQRRLRNMIFMLEFPQSSGHLRASPLKQVCCGSCWRSRTAITKFLQCTLGHLGLQPHVKISTRANPTSKSYFMNDNLVYHKWQCLKYEQYDGCETIKVLRDGGDPGRRSYLRSSERPK